MTCKLPHPHWGGRIKPAKHPPAWWSATEPHAVHYSGCASCRPDHATCLNAQTTLRVQQAVRTPPLLLLFEVVLLYVPVCCREWQARLPQLILFPRIFLNTCFNHFLNVYRTIAHQEKALECVNVLVQVAKYAYSLTLRVVAAYLVVLVVVVL